MGRASRETPKHLGENLLQIRTELGLSQDGMLRRSGLAQEYGRHYISGFETGEREPSFLVLLKYSEVARVWINALVDDEVNLPRRISNTEMQPGIKQKRAKDPQATLNLNGQVLDGAAMQSTSYRLRPFRPCRRSLTRVIATKSPAKSPTAFRTSAA